MASRMPLALGRDVIGLAPGENSLATVLRERGYATAAFSAGNPYISARFGYDQGFDLFYDGLDFRSDEMAGVAGESPVPEQIAGNTVRGPVNRALRRIAGTLGAGPAYDELYFRYCMKRARPAGRLDALRRFPSADVLLQQAKSWLGSMGRRPFFLWLHFMDPHSPYYPSAAAFHTLTGRTIGSERARWLNAFWNRSDLLPARLRKKLPEIVELYDAGVRHVDNQIAELVSTLRSMGVWDDCVFTVTADHGEEFLEHGGRYHAPVHLSEEVVRVPLLIRAPNWNALRGTDSAMSHLHLAPTLLDLMQVPAPPSFRGRSLRTQIERGTGWDDPAFIECSYGCTNPFLREGRKAPRLLAVRNARHKLVLRMEPGEIETMYDLRADPLESACLGNGVAVEERKWMLQAALANIQESIANRDERLRLRALLRDLRLGSLG